MSGAVAFESFAASWFELLLPAALEAAVLGVVVWLLVRFGRRAPSSLRYGLLVLAIVKFLLPPVPAPWARQIELPVPVQPALARVTGTLQPAAALMSSEPSAGVAQRSFVDGAEALRAGIAPAATVRKKTTPGRIVQSSVSIPAQLEESRSPRLGLGARLLLIQLVGALCLLVVRVRQLIGLRRVLREAEPVSDDALLGIVRDTSTRQGLPSAPELVSSPAGIGPAAAGLWRRRIILPAAIIERVPASRLRPVIAHEVAHHRRRDLWIESLVFVGSLVWWAHPVYWLLRHELRHVGEDCCDDMAVVDAGRASSYCQSLLDAASALGGHRPGLPAVAHGSFSHPLGRRIQRIMNPSTRPSPRLSLLAFSSLVLLAAVVVPSAYTLGAPVPAQSAPPPPPRVATAPAVPAQAESLPPPLAPVPAATVPRTLRPAMAPHTLPPASAVPPAFAPLPSIAQQRIFSRGRNISLGVDDGIIEISAGAIDELVDRGMDESFLEQLDGSENRVLTLDELRQWASYGIDAGLPDELEALGVRQLRVMQVLQLVWSDADGAYVRSLRESGIPGLGLDEVIQLARYEVTGQYIGDFRAQGYTDLDTEDLVQLSRYDVAPGYAGTYREAGYDLSVEDLVQLHRYDVDEEEVARLAAVGLDALSVEDLVTLARYEIDDTYIREMTEDGDVDVSVEDLVTLSRYEVTPGYAQEMREAGLDTSTEGLVQLKRYSVEPGLVQRYAEVGQTDIGVVQLQRYDVNPEYVVGLQQLGYTSPSVEDLVTLQRYEVDLDRISALADAGYATLTVSDLVKLQRYEVSAEFIRALGATVSRQLSVEELVTLRRYEVTAEYVAGIEAVGFGDLEVEQIVQLKRYEVDPEFIQRLQAAGFDDLDVAKIIRLKRADG